MSDLYVRALSVVEFGRLLAAFSWLLFCWGHPNIGAQGAHLLVLLVELLAIGRLLVIRQRRNPWLGVLATLARAGVIVAAESLLERSLMQMLVVQVLGGAWLAWDVALTVGLLVPRSERARPQLPQREESETVTSAEAQRRERASHEVVQGPPWIDM